MATLTTPRLGIPYPDGNERVQDGDNAMGAIASTLDDLTKTGVPYRMQAGNGTANIAAGQSNGSFAVTLTAGRFTTAPMVVASVATATQQFFCTTTTPTASGFTVNVQHRDGTVGAATIVVHWIAVQMLATGGAG